MKIKLISILIILISTSAYAGEWIISKDSKCKVWNPNPASGESVSYTGKCNSEVASEKGIVTWFQNGKKTAMEEGIYQNGRIINGKINDVRYDSNGLVKGSFNGNLRDGEKNGNGLWEKFKTGSLVESYEGEYKNGTWHGKGTHKKYQNGKIIYSYSGKYVNGKRSGKYTEEVLKAIKDAESGSLYAQKTLAALFRDGAKDVKKDPKKSFYWMLKAAKQNDAQSQFNVANKYVKGTGTVKNYNLAKKWFLKSGGNGFPQGYVEIGTMYANGENQDGSRNYDEALKWFLKAANKGDLQGQFSVGIAYENGLGVKQNYMEAIKWYKKTANNGYTKSELEIAKTYKTKKGEKLKGICESFKWYKKAAKKVEVAIPFHNIKDLSDAGCTIN